ncbi:MAG: hypothetical protein UU16_C0046G0003 [Candidatus Woesebacteria bacterium GW2011_GWA2_40_7]|uniref:Mannosyl-glycoprotein endo-beta-N-acetylglucosamidase-like domain-containing protein n=3 Tax=Candidatus Woeseibacteriota TaxID=1752722 RepID=A0A0G0X676_9BACT|nr:MAG: hypothetical protein UT17_C0006G0003 [Candidatus Woesebacteria bacterium GW2011_GWB1_39_10]KKR72089.1 MAG: hypothetical protein UU16_C0046G0003 [Candidatus Woesebacteria bacterium GW2011_GWA2_40_7]KKR92135.1 MAG: hypothetical protein UU42_C0003G0004 [Candidatus Woesebacteria bacterium GW2011_GWA1_41_13b]
METSLFGREENISFWKNVILIAVFFTITPITLGISIFSLFSLKSGLLAKEVLGTDFVSPSQSGVRVYASLPTKLPTISSEVGKADARPEIVKQYLEYYHSPLVPYANLIVAVSDKYSIDFRLISAIAQQESNLCKIIPPGSYNCWGWGITSVGTLGFDSYEDGIETVSKGLRENYLNKGYITINDIMSKYTPQSNGSWANGVSQFMAEME